MVNIFEFDAHFEHVRVLLDSVDDFFPRRGLSSIFRGPELVFSLLGIMIFFSFVIYKGLK